MRTTTAKIISGAIVIVLALSACTDKPDVIEPSLPGTPSVAASQTTNTSEPTKTPEIPSEPRPTEPDPEKPTKSASPEPSVTSSDAGTPAVQFASRWGKRYPNVPEYAILKAANGVCVVSDQYGEDWLNNPLAEAAINELVQFAGISENDAVEFAQDARQNYCASVSNPT